MKQCIPVCSSIRKELILVNYKILVYKPRDGNYTMVYNGLSCHVMIAEYKYTCSGVNTSLQVYFIIHLAQNTL